MTLTADRPTSTDRTAPPASGAHGTWEAVCPLEGLEPLWAEAALVHGEQVALVRLPSDEVLAVSHWDPHASAYVMARGIVGSRNGRPTLASPLHKQVYDLSTGQCLSDPDLSLQTYPVRVVDRIVQIAA